MNNTRLRFYFKILAFTVLFFISCGFQTSFWPNIITFIPSPQIWLIMIIFMTISWRPLFTIFYLYFLGYCLTRFSEIPLKMVWSTLIVTYSVVWFVKNRIQLTGAFSFVVLTLLGSTVFEITYYNFSDFLEVTPTSFMFIDRALQILVNFIFSYPLYFVLNKFNTLLFDENEWKRSTTDHHHEMQHE
ncbi:hypothetical protein K2P97_06665 [bacterium]|nr:hypothetical protein [bacterium]